MRKLRNAFSVALMLAGVCALAQTKPQKKIVLGEEEVVYLTDEEAAAWEAEHGVEEIDRSPAAVKKKSAKKPSEPRKMRVKQSSGADSEEGWIIRRDENGKLVKVRAKQTFVFKGSEVQGASNRPSQTLFGQRPSYRPATLIPERASFRQEFFEASGYTGTGRSR